MCFVHSQTVQSWNPGITGVLIYAHFANVLIKFLFPYSYPRKQWHMYRSNVLPISRQHFPIHEKDVQSDGFSWNCFSSRFNLSQMHSLLLFLIYKSESRKNYVRWLPVPAGYMSTHMFPGAIRFLYELRWDQPLSDEAFQCFQITFRTSECSVSESCTNKLSYYRKDTYFCSFCKMSHKMEIARQTSRFSSSVVQAAVASIWTILLLV